MSLQRPEEANKEEEEALQKMEKDDDGVLVSIVSALFRKESIKYKDQEPTPTTKKWIYIYKHPLGGLRAMQAQREMRVMHYLPPEQRVMTAVTRNNAWLVEELAITGHPLEVKNESGYTPLHIAAGSNFWEVVNVLVTVGVEVNMPTNLGYTPLYVALSAGAYEAAVLIQEAGGVKELPKKQLPGKRTVLDTPIPKPKRALDAKAKNLGRRPYIGQF